MHFIFGYCREVPVKLERKTSKAVLVGIVLLVVLLFIFLSFENIDGEILPSHQSYQTSSSLVQPGGMDNLEIDSKTHLEQSFRRPEFKNSSRLWGEPYGSPLWQGSQSQ